LDTEIKFAPHLHTEYMVLAADTLYNHDLFILYLLLLYKSLKNQTVIYLCSNVDDNRSWMYKERKGKMFTPAWQHGLDNFLERAFSLPDAVVAGESHCPCTKCFCRHKLKRDVMTRHLCNNGFMLGYERWTSHGEHDTPEIVQQDNDGGEDVDRMDDMLIDAIAAEGVSVGDEPTEAAKKFYEMLVEADKPLHEKTTQSRLSIVGRLMTIKTQHNLSEAC
jgi:hypothetical protein